MTSEHINISKQCLFTGILRQYLLVFLGLHDLEVESTAIPSYKYISTVCFSLSCHSFMNCLKVNTQILSASKQEIHETTLCYSKL